MKRLLLAAFAAALLMAAPTSCRRKGDVAEPQPAPAGRIAVESVEGFERTGLLSGEVALRVNSSMRGDITVEEGTVTLFYAGSKVCVVELRGAVTVPGREVSVVKVPLGLAMANPLAAYGAWNKIRRGEIDRLSLTAECRVKAGLVRRNLKIGEMPLRRAFEAMGVTERDIAKISI